jgi:Flp pilus assembly protein TadD
VVVRDLEPALVVEGLPEDRVLLATAYIALGRLEDARRQLEQAREQAPEHVGTLVTLGNLAAAEGDLSGAETIYTEADRLSKAPGVARVKLALLFLSQGRTHEANALLDGLPFELVKGPDVALRIARAEREAGRAERALAALAIAVPENPQHRLLLRTFAAELQAAGRPDAALQSLRQIHALDPTDPSSKNDLAWGLAVAGVRLDRALGLARQAAKALDGDPAGLATLATVHLVRGEPFQALRAADRALALDPAPQLRPHLLYVRAASLSEIGRPVEAEEALRALRRETIPLDPPWHERATALARHLGMDANEEVSAQEGASTP